MKMLCEYDLGDMLARYVTDGQGHVGLMLLPAGRAALASLHDTNKFYTNQWTAYNAHGVRIFL